MKRKKKENLEQVLNDEEFKENAELAIEDGIYSSEEDGEDFSDDKKEKPILTEQEIKVRRARRTKVAVAAFVLLLGVGVMGNWYYENSDFSAVIKPSVTSSDTKTLGEAEYVDAKAQNENESKYFSEARVNREKARSEALEKLRNIIDSPDADEGAKSTASEKLADISSYISIENKIETLVTAKGAENCLAVISEDGKRVDVIVDVEELSDTMILKIKEIAMQQLGCTFENVTIIQSGSDS